MSEKVKADLDKLDRLRDLALCGPEDQREQSQQAYEELRAELLDHEKCGGCDETEVTKELPMQDKTLTCENCGEQFTYSIADQQLYKGQGIEEPKICIDCRRSQGEDKSEIKGEGESGGVGGFNS